MKRQFSSLTSSNRYWLELCEGFLQHSTAHSCTRFLNQDDFKKILLNACTGITNAHVDATWKQLNIDPITQQVLFTEMLAQAAARDSDRKLMELWMEMPLQQGGSVQIQDIRSALNGVFNDASIDIICGKGARDLLLLIFFFFIPTSLVASHSLL